ncbi:hypothetical protein RCL1_009005 [Eukaryota sp. TZLM3-RCL]
MNVIACVPITALDLTVHRFYHFNSSSYPHLIRLYSVSLSNSTLDSFISVPVIRNSSVFISSLTVSNSSMSSLIRLPTADVSDALFKDLELTHSLISSEFMVCSSLNLHS